MFGINLCSLDFGKSSKCMLACKFSTCGFVICVFGLPTTNTTSPARKSNRLSKKI